MNKIFIILFIIILSITNSSYATPTEGPIMPKENKWFYGFQYNTVKNQEMDYLDGKTESEGYYLNLSYGIKDYLCLDGKLGVGDVFYNRDIGEAFFYDKSFSGGYGLRVKTFKEEDEGIKLILGAHHICVHPKSERDSGNLKQEVIWDDWQFDSVIFKEFGAFLPYIGVKLKKVYLIRKINGERVRMKSCTQLGGSAGFNYKINDKFFINMELRFADEQAYTVGVTYEL